MMEFPKVSEVTFRIRQSAFTENLKQQVEETRVCFLEFVEQDDTERLVPDFRCEQSFWSSGTADEAIDG